VTEAPGSEPCPPVYLWQPAKFVLVPDPSPNRFASKEQFLKNSYELESLLHIVCAHGRILKIFYLQNAFHADA